MYIYRYVMPFNMNFLIERRIIEMITAAENGDIELVKKCKEKGAINYDVAMFYAAENGHIELVKLFKQWGAIGCDKLCIVQLKMVILNL